MAEHIYTTENSDYQRLRALGFSEIQATRLISMKEHVIEQIEYREILEEQHRLKFVRWLIEHKRLVE